jgi:hypothetical protein
MQYFFLQLNTCGYSPYIPTSLTRGRVCRLQLLLVLASAVILGSDCRGTHAHVLLSQIRDSPNLEGQVPVFISPRNRVAQLYPQAQGSNFVTSDHSKGCGRDIGTRLHRGLIRNDGWFSVYNLSTNCTENTASNSSSVVVACMSVAAFT